jgi:hypothetical protein
MSSDMDYTQDGLRTLTEHINAVQDFARASNPAGYVPITYRVYCFFDYDEMKAAAAELRLTIHKEWDAHHNYQTASFVYNGVKFYHIFDFKSTIERS